MSDHLYVYFRVPEALADAALPHWHRWMETVAEAGGIGGTLLRRPETRDGMQTWMEAYADVPPAFDLFLDGLWRQSGLQHFINGERQVERFVDLDQL
ncbi:hypothetical protein UB46_05590 [Burkholderiaceae bacterium 16]|nr:hypothetical protein UB46_05590 [Burkholderiaceae bacterium 16]